MRTFTTKLPADLSTPVGIYLTVRDLYPQSILLESSDYHTSQNSISLVGVDPIGYFKVLGERIYMKHPEKESCEMVIKNPSDVIASLKAYMSSFASLKLPSPLINGLLGYTAYDAVRFFEPSVGVKVSEECFSEIPDLYYLFFRYIIQVNHFHNEMTIIENCPEGDASRTNELISVLKNNDVAQYSFVPGGNLTSPVTDESFKDIIRKCIGHCRGGDVFQIVPSRRFSLGFKGDDFNVYRALRSVNPSPYLFYFDFGSFRIFGSSPETHIRIKDGCAWIDPIAGTFKRTGHDARDKELAESLLADPKENAEHVMLVDLARNDLSRSGGKVEIEYLKQIQFYSHVIHMVSRVKATLPADADIYSLFASTFPAGTLTGAPKVRAMQIIEELEPHSRKIYGGCLGYIGFDESMNQAITIRSFLSVDNKLYFQSGMGVVARSSPESELQEANNKLGALRVAIDRAVDFNN